MDATGDVEHGVEEPLLGLSTSQQQGPGGEQVEHWSRRAARTAYLQLQQFGFCILFGMITAIGLKTVGTSVAVAVVLLFIGFQVLAWYGFVSVQWSTVGAIIKRRMDMDGDGRVDVKDVGIACSRLVKLAVSWGLISTAGFTVGFVGGWRLI